MQRLWEYHFSFNTYYCVTEEDNDTVVIWYMYPYGKFSHAKTPLEGAASRFSHYRLQSDLIGEFDDAP